MSRRAEPRLALVALLALPAASGCARATLLAREVLPLQAQRDIEEVVLRVEPQPGFGDIALREPLDAVLRDAISSRLAAAGFRVRVERWPPPPPPPPPATAAGPSAAYAPPGMAGGEAASPAASRGPDWVPPQPPGVASLDVWLGRAWLSRTAAEPGHHVAVADVRPALTTGSRRRWDEEEPTGLMVTHPFVLADRTLIRSEDLAGESPPALAAAARRLAERAAERIVVALLETTVEGVWGSYRSCGPAFPSAVPKGRDGSASVRLAWEEWEPRAARGEKIAVSYDVRLWRVSEGAAAALVEAREGIAGARTTFEGLAPGDTYAWTVRGVARLPGGRRVATSWSHDRPEVGGCAVDPDPARASRFETPGKRAARVPPAAGSVRVAASYGAAPIAPVPTSGAEVAGGVAKGAGYGMLRGAGESLRCGIFFPLCAVVMIPAGLVIGGTFGGVGAVPSGPRQPDLAAEPVRSGLDRALRRLAADPALHARIAAAATAAATEPGGAVEVTAVDLRLVAWYGELRPADLWLGVSGRRLRPGAAADEREVRVRGFSGILAHVWLEDDAALLAAAVPPLADDAGALLAAELERPLPEPPPPAPEAAPEPYAPPGM